MRNIKKLLYHNQFVVRPMAPLLPLFKTSVFMAAVIVGQRSSLSFKCPNKDRCFSSFRCAHLKLQGRGGTVDPTQAGSWRGVEGGVGGSGEGRWTSQASGGRAVGACPEGKVPDKPCCSGSPPADDPEDTLLLRLLQTARQSATQLLLLDKTLSFLSQLSGHNTAKMVCSC